MHGMLKQNCIFRLILEYPPLKMLKKLLLIFIGLASNTYIVNAQCSETEITRIMLIGDSWAQFIGADGSINTNLSKWGHTKYKFYTNSVLAENGTQTTTFVDPVRLAEIQNQLNLHPDIDLVHLSLGGNDVLSTWNVNYTSAQTDSLLDSVYARLTFIIDFIKTAKPGVRVLWSGYAYPNFGEIISELAPFQSTHPFYGLWSGMGFPTFSELNTILNTYSNSMDSLAANDPQVEFVRGTGLMQYYYGQTTNLGVPPGGTYPAFSATLPDGFSNYPSPKPSMRNYVIFRDCFHLSPDAFDKFVEYQTQKFYHKALMDDQYFISEGGNRDGSVSSSGVVSTFLQMGNDGTDDFATVLSFNTAVMPDTGVSNASIFIRRESLTGTNPIGNNLQLKIVSGSFSLSADVEAADYTDPGDGSAVPCLFGSNNGNEHWIRLEIPAALLPFISNDTLTQFVISAPGAAGLVTFTGAADADFAPVLNITYGSGTVSLPENDSRPKLVHTYPNPTYGPLLIESNGAKILEIEVYNLPGELVLKQVMKKNSVNLHELPSGMYIVKIYTETGVVVNRVVKR